MGNYDSWLEAPYQAMYEESERFYAWCEHMELDPDDPATELRYDQFVEDQYQEYAEYLAEREADREWDDEPYWDDEPF